MPLETDSSFRGLNSVHVHRHRKLDRSHSTVMKSFLPLASMLVDMKEVSLLRFGKIVNTNNDQPRLVTEVKRATITALFVSAASAQVIHISVFDGKTNLPLMLEKIQKMWDEVIRNE